MRQFFNSPVITISMFDAENIVTNASSQAMTQAEEDIIDKMGELAHKPIVVDLMSFKTN